VLIQPSAAAAADGDDDDDDDDACCCAVEHPRGRTTVPVRGQDSSDC